MCVCIQVEWRIRRKRNKLQTRKKRKEECKEKDAFTNRSKCYGWFSVFNLLRSNIRLFFHFSVVVFFRSLPSRRDFFSWVSKENKLSTFFHYLVLHAIAAVNSFFSLLSWQSLHSHSLYFFFCYQIFIPFEFQVVAKDFCAKNDEKKEKLLFCRMR